MKKEKTKIYRFVKCSGYLKKNKNLWRVRAYDRNGNEVTNLNEGVKFIAEDNFHKSPMDCGDHIHQEYYNFVQEEFEGFLVEVKNIRVFRDLELSYDAPIDVGLGTIPERTYLGSYNERYVKVGKVYINKNGVYRLVPVQNILD